MTWLFSTDRVPVANRFRACQEWNRELFGPSKLIRREDGVFSARYGKMVIGSLSVCRFETGPADNAINPRDRGRRVDTDHLTFIMLNAGRCFNEQLDRNVALQPGDMFVADNRFARSVCFPDDSDVLSVSVRRERLERSVGSSRLFAGLPIGGGEAGAVLVRDFFANLVAVGDGLAPEMSERIASVGVDLVVATLAERLGREPSHSVNDTALMQRAKAYVEANLGDPSLDPNKLAAAMGVSLRRLHQLFEGYGRGVADWVWERRVAAAGRRLADLAAAVEPISRLASDCGFTSPAHFSRRFRDHFGASPREYRVAALAARSSDLAA